MIIINLGGKNLSEKYNGILDNYLECGQDVAIAFHPPPTHLRGSTKARKIDKPGRFATPPGRFQGTIPRGSLCVVISVPEGHPPPVAILDVGTYSGYDGDLQAYEVYLRLEDTSKAARRNFNGVARLAPPPLDDEWFKDGDSEADLTGVHQPISGGASWGHLLLHFSEDSAAQALQLYSPVTPRDAGTFRSVLCGMNADDYFEYDLLSGVDPATRDRILSAIHPMRRAPRSDYLTRIPCGGMVLVIAQGRPFLLIASRHEAVDACLKKVESIVVRVFDAAEDKSACKRVILERDNWRSTPFRARSRWRPHLSVAFWVGYFLGLETSPWTGRCLDATTSPSCFQDALNVTRQLNSSLADMSEVMKSRLHNTFSVHVDLCIDYIFRSALLVAATPYGALGKVAKWLTRNQFDFTESSV
ncbi:hypothetical protein F5883DRAFT_639167 [Diaporthe sp. PMI_573]|nr:hypothetical protein F5883DRAFT_639167 [Diaporthaceae sp. PMI_573]